MTRFERRPRAVAVELLTLAALFVAPTLTARADVPGQVVNTQNGPVSGTVTDQGRKFLGIPYAAPPTGANRWKPPVAPQNWSATRNATQFGSNCPQPASPFGLASTNEDCLYLNVYTPPVGQLGGALRNDPVLVWIHPGAFLYGEGSDFDPKQLVGRGLVVVTLNYRLGALGFLAHPALTAEGSGSSGNYGFLDQQAALRWVKRNISKFGGNPNKITIGGESAGGLSSHAHMVAPGSAGLFQNAIIQSGAYTLTLPTVAASEPAGSALATAVGCTNQDAACLRNTPVATLLANQGTNPNAYLPRVDGATLPLSIGAAFASGQFNRANVLEGSTHDEFTLFIASLFTLQGVPVTAANYGQLIAAVLQIPAAAAPQVVPLIVAQYPLASYSAPELALAAVATDAVFACNASAAAQLLTKYVPIWSYEFDDPDAPQIFLPPVSYPYGAYHGSELKYLFDVREPIPGTLTPPQKQLSDAMVLHWSNFVRFGNPNTLQTSVWPRYQPPQTDRVQLLTPPAPQAYTQTAFIADHKCAFWKQLQGGGS
jgi:para-nitrobenzyl esterase